jgi:hypothetical protein
MDIFDYKFYYTFYQDLQKNNINTPAKLLIHYKKNGIQEKRYKNKYEFLKKINFNHEIYRYNYEDIQHLSDLELEEHFVNHGFREGRDFINIFDKNLRNLDFCVEYYKSNNSDLQNMSWLELYKHFETFGYLENRKYHPKKKQIMPKNIFLEPIKTVENLNLLEFKEKHREICLNELNLIQKIKIQKNNRNIDRETIFIEFRILPNIEFIIRNMMIKLPDWNHTIVCGKNNYEYIYDLRSKISEDINIINFNNIENISPSEYSKLLTKINFWEKFSGEKLLIYQEDSIIFHSNICKFLEYDYVGAPWPINQDDNNLGVGNGGFSLRSKSVMIKCLEKNKPEDLKYGDSTLEYMKNNECLFYPEDVYFSKSIIDFNLGKVAPRNIAIQFSQETQKYSNPLGGHQFWIAENKITLPYIKRYNIFDTYYKSVTHRGGWKNVIENLIDEKIAVIENYMENNITLIDCCESFFLWNKIYERVELGRWVGIIHFCPNLPDFLFGENIKYLLSNEIFIKNLDNCICIVVLSEYLKIYIQNIFPELRIEVIKHPIKNINNKFSIENFIANKQKCLIHLGYQSRIISTIFRINTSLKKIILSGRKYNCKMIISRVKKENKFMKIKNNDITSDDVNLKYFEKNEDYDNFLNKNICIIPLWDASANNSILEIIEMNIPTFVTKIDSTVFYLGVNYPMFFNEIEEINNIVNNEREFYNIIIKTNEYLKNMEKKELSYNNFNSEILRIINR